MTRPAGPSPASSLAAVLRDPLRETAQPVHLAPAPPTRMFPMRALVLVVLCALGATVAAAPGTAIVIPPESAGVMVPPPRLPPAPPDLRRWFRRLGIEKSWGTADSRSSLTLATGGTFNRVEGLPVVFGPLFDWKLHRNVRLRVDALGVFRTAGDFTDKRSDLGYLLRTELRAGGTPAYGIEFRAFDDVTPVEDWGLRAD